MPRVCRGLADGFYYHIINRGNGCQEVFHKDQDYRSFLKLLLESIQRYPVRLHAYCLMANHFHLLVSPERAEDLSKWMQWLMTSQVRRYHKHFGSSGHVWQGRFKSFIVQEDSHLVTVVRYIEGNPVRAGIVSSATGWAWSSHNDRINGLRNHLSQLPIALPGEWTKYVDEPLTATELEKLRKSVNRQAPYGEEKWQERIGIAFGLGFTMKPRGRPRKNMAKN